VLEHAQQRPLAPTLDIGSQQSPTPVGIAAAQIPTLAQASERIPTLFAPRNPTLVSSGTGARVGLMDWPSRPSEHGKTKIVDHTYDYACDDYDAMYWDENVDPYVVRNAVCPPMYGDRRGYSAFHAPVPSPAVPDVFDRHRTFRPISRGHGETSRHASRSRG